MDNWDPHFYKRSEFFQPLTIDYVWQQFNHWPTLSNYNASLENKILTCSGKNLQCVKQNFNQYELSIYERGELQTREQNWHDFFNLLVWLTFPKTKAILNQQQYQALHQRLPQDKQRTQLENLLAHFDENGVIVLSSQPSLTQLLYDFSWKELFWQHRVQLNKHMRFFIFGHGLYEKLLNPYIGLTANAIILEVEHSLLTMNLAELIQYSDFQLGHLLQNSAWLQTTKKLNPLPLLGIPGYWSANNQEIFYNNLQYFRPKKID